MAKYATTFSGGDQNPLSEGGIWDGGYSGQDSFQVISGGIRPLTAGVDGIMSLNSISPGAAQYAVSTIKTLTGTNNRVGTACRMAVPSDYTAYLGQATTIFNKEAMIIKDIAPTSYTEIAVIASVTWAAGNTVMLTASADLITVYKNGGSLGGVTDSGISSGRVGVQVYTNVTEAETEIDAFEGGDLSELYPAPGGKGFGESVGFFTWY